MLHLLRQMYIFIKPDLRTVIFAMFCIIPISIVPLLRARYIEPVIDGIFAANTSHDHAIWLCSVYLLITIVSYPFRFYHYFWVRMIVDRATCRVRNHIYHKFQFLSSEFFAKNKQGKLLSVMISDTYVFAEGFMHLTSCIREPLTGILLMGFAFYKDWQLTLILLSIFPLLLITLKTTGKRIRRYINRAQEDVANMTHHAAEGLIGQKIIKAFNLQDYMMGRFEFAQVDFLAHKAKSNSAEEHSHPLVDVISTAGLSVILYTAYFKAQHGMSVGEFMSCFGALVMVQDPIKRFTKANGKLNQARGAAERIFELLKQPEELDEGKKEFKNFQSSIEFRNVTFSYGKGDVVKNFSLKIAKGEKVALVGLSGSGKSTLVSLLLRLYDIEQGEILLDGINIKDYTIQSLRNAIALVSQDIFLFNDSIRENLVAGDQYDEEQIARALKVSYAEEFIKDLPDNLETHIGDRGLKLSGGQGQRITIARAFLRDCPILLFDEATSALDNESESVIQKALDEVSGHKTVLAVAHRLSTIQNYDRIIVMKEGIKIEEGTHDELMSKNGEYQKLYELTRY